MSHYAHQVEIEIHGKPVQVHWSAAAHAALAERAQPLVMELELYFSCLVKKFVHFHEHVPTAELAYAQPKLGLYFRPVMSTACSIEAATRLGRQPETEIESEAVRRMAPKAVWLDYRQGAWEGAFRL